LRALKQDAVGKQVRRLRLGAGLSLRSLAGRTSFSPSFISQVENGQVSPSIASMEKIAAVLGVTLGEFFSGVAASADPQLVRAKDRPQAQSAWSQASIAMLSQMGRGHALEPLLITLEPQGRSAKHPAAPGREEFVFVLEGEVTTTLGPDQLTLRPGDALTVRPRELRRYENQGSVTARFLAVSPALGPAKTRASRASKG
jgi:transcriptional regulator with XRE-family HTH domain